MAFVRKVYSILAVQLLFTAIVSVVMSQASVVEWTRSNTWFFWLPLVGTFASLGVLFWKIDSHPINLVILGVFTLFEAMSIGTVVSFVSPYISFAIFELIRFVSSCRFYEQKIVIQALVITLGVFIGLSLFTLQSKVKPLFPLARDGAQKLTDPVAPLLSKNVVGFRRHGPLVVRWTDGHVHHLHGLHLLPFQPGHGSLLGLRRLPRLLWLHYL